MKQKGNEIKLKRGDLYCSPLYSSLNNLDRRVWLVLRQNISDLSQKHEDYEKMTSFIYNPESGYEDFINLRNYYSGEAYEKFVVIK